jgi:hypothetical protein
VLDVVFYDAVRKIRFSKEPARPRGLEPDVRYLYPADGSETVKAQLADSDLKVGGKRQDVVPSSGAAGNAHIPHHASDSPAGYKYAKALAPNPVKLVKKTLVGRNIAKLAVVIRISL